MGQAALKTQPSGELLSKAAIGKRVGLHVQTVTSRLEMLGYKPDASSTVKNHLYWFTDEMDREIRSAKDDISAAKIHGLRLDNELKQMKIDQASGDLVPMADAVELVQKIVGAVYQEFTIRQPKRIAPKLARAKNVIEVKKIQKADTDRIMKSLRTNFERFIGD